jgi:hypothetical protein
VTVARADPSVAHVLPALEQKIAEFTSTVLAKECSGNASDVATLLSALKSECTSQGTGL